jgi:hypothetical protein
MEFSIQNKIICFCAKRNSGKSQLLRYLVNCSKDLFGKIFVICPTESVNHFYKDLVPAQNIFSQYKEEWVESLISKLTDVNAGKNDEDAKHILLILDDCCSDTKFHQSKTLKQLATRGRHIKIAVLITCQYIYQIPPIVRNNCDFIYVGQMNAQSIKLLTTEFLMGNIDKKQFVDLYHSNTNDYNFLVINNNSTTDNNDIGNIYGRIKCPSNHIK